MADQEAAIALPLPAQEVEDPHLQFVAMWCKCGDAISGYVGVLRCSSCGRLWSVSRMEVGQAVSARPSALQKSGGYQPIANGPPPTAPPPKREDSLRSVTPPARADNR